MVFNGTFNTISVISWRSVLLVKETLDTRWKTPTCRKSLTNFITYYYTSLICFSWYAFPIILLALLDHVNSDYFWQYDLWWNHYWLCDRYHLAILIPSKNKMVAFIAWISKKHDLSCSDRDHEFSPSSIKIDINIGIW
jgi:hypothetical protein